MIEQLHPLSRPLGATVTPGTSPLCLSPWISQFYQSLPIDFSRLHDAVRMPLQNAVSASVLASHLAASKQKLLIDFHQLLLPKLFLVQNIRREQFGRDSARQILNAFAHETGLERSIIAMSLGIRLLEKRQPRLIFIRALREEQRPGPNLHTGSPLLFGIASIAQIQPPLSLLAPNIVKIALDQIELIVNDAADPLAVSMKHKAIHTHILVSRHAHPRDEARLLGERGQRAHKPTVALLALPDVAGRGTLDKEARPLKNVAYPLDARRPQLLLVIII